MRGKMGSADREFKKIGKKRNLEMGQKETTNEKG